MRVCQFAFIGSENVGDEALFETIYRDLQTLRPEQHTILSINPERTRRRISTERTSVLSSNSVIDTIRAIRACDLFVCGGGGLFQDHTSIYNPMRYLAPIEAANRLGKSVYVYAVSIGPLNRRLNREATGRILSRVACITVRDHASRGELISMGVPSNVIHITSDPVLNFVPSLVPRPMPKAWRKVVVCLRHWFDSVSFLPVSIVHALRLRGRENVVRYQQFIEAVARVLDHVASDPEIKLTFLPFWAERDNQVHRDVAGKMKHVARTEILEAASPARAQEIICEADLVLGMRLHSLIMAAAACRPFFAVDYSKKVGDFLESLVPGRAQELSVSPVDLNASVAIDKLEKLRESDAFGDDYVAAVTRLKTRERENVRLLHATFGRSG
jgi:polysaccharide pyruvyl transferase WcaK-like protein